MAKSLVLRVVDRPDINSIVEKGGATELFKQPVGHFSQPMILFQISSFILNCQMGYIQLLGSPEIYLLEPLPDRTFLSMAENRA